MAVLTILQETAGSPPSFSLADFLSSVDVGAGVRTLVILVLGIPLVHLAARWCRRWTEKQLGLQAGLVAGKLIFYSGMLAVAVSVLRELGFSLAPLLGAAGVLGIALGFASQTSISNVISGLFLLMERPFVVDDVIQVGDVTGRVRSIDTISVRLRTFDNRMVRIPNETLVKSQVVNITHYPIRRVDVRVGVAYKEDAGRVRAVLLDVANRNPMSLMEPEPVVIFEGFGDSSINFLLGVWATQENWLALKNSIQEEVKARLDAEGIEIPFPHRTLYVGSATDAFPVRMVPPSGEAPSGPTSP